MKTKVEVEQCVCGRCGYKWLSRVVNPKVCADCHSPFWDSERKNKRREEQKAKRRH